MKKIKYGGQYIDSKDQKTVLKSLQNDLITTGKNVKLFEDKIKKFVGSKYAVSCNSGTSAIHLALKSLKLKKKSVVIMPSINFISAYNLCRLLDFKIFFTDVNSLTGQTTPENIIKCIKI